MMIKWVMTISIISIISIKNLGVTFPPVLSFPIIPFLIICHILSFIVICPRNFMPMQPWDYALTIGKTENTARITFAKRGRT